MRPLNQLLKVCLFISILSCVTQGKLAAQMGAAKQDPVNIGLLVADSTSVAARFGAELAVRKANASGGYEGRPFRLVVRYLDGPWGTGSKQAVDLIFGEKVWVLLGSHDGRNAHLVEQAATKSGIVFVSAWTGDPTLSQAFVPWFFNCVQNDDQQAAALVREICKNESGGSIGIVYDDEYDSRLLLNSFLQKFSETGNNKSSLVQLNANGNDPAKTGAMICQMRCRAVVLFCKPETGVMITKLLLPYDHNLKIFASLSVLNENVLRAKGLLIPEKVINVPSSVWNEKELSGFKESYIHSFGRTPGTVAAYAYDAMNVVIMAIKKAGSNDRERLQEALCSSNYNGVTGLIRFDNKGNRTGEVEIFRIENEIPADISK